jgi:hypothetical protein
MTTKHTPGPWTVGGIDWIEPYPESDPRYVGGQRVRLVDGPEYLAAMVMADEEDEKESHANARLIAAAPDMLAMMYLAFEAIRALWREEPWDEGDIPQVMDEIQELIATATEEASS